MTERAERAYHLRGEGVTWAGVAESLRYSSPRVAEGAAKGWRMRSGAPWPPTRGPGRPPLSGEPTVQLKIAVPKSLRDAVNVRAAENGEKSAALVRRAIARELGGPREVTTRTITRTTLESET